MSSEGALHGARLTAGYLGGGLVLGLGLALGVERLPLVAFLRHGLSGLVALGVVAAAGAGWGRALAGVRWAGSVAFGPAVLAVGIVLGTMEPALVARGATLGAPVHTVFTAVFATAAFCVAAVGGGALGIALGSGRLAARMGLSAGLAGALAFVGVALLMDAAGWRVGAPDAAKRATMLTVTAIGILASALAGGAAIGRLLATQLAATQRGGVSEAIP